MISCCVQDVNVGLSGQSRIDVKTWQDILMLPPQWGLDMFGRRGFAGEDAGRFFGTGIYFTDVAAKVETPFARLADFKGVLTAHVDMDWWQRSPGL